MSDNTDLEASNERIRILITGGTFDKQYDELKGNLLFKDSNLPKMPAPGPLLSSR